MRILHVLDHSAPVHSGYTFRTLAILREQRKRGWETFHLTSPKHEGAIQDEEVVDGWHFFRTQTLPGVSSRLVGLREIRLMRDLQKRLLEVAQRVKPDVIHAHSPVLNAFPAFRVGRQLGIPVVYEVRAFWEDAAVDHGTAREWGVRYRLTRSLETAAVRRADHVTTICEGLRAELVSRGIEAGKITVIPNAVDSTAFRLGGAGDPQLRGQLGLDGATVLGFIGSFYAYEGLRLVIQTLPAIIQQQPDVKLLLVGGGPEEGVLRSCVRGAGLQDRVIFTGRVPNEQVGKYYELMDLLIYARQPMRLTELVTPLKPLEAMAQGRLFVASDVGGHRELIRDGETGFLFKAGDTNSLAQVVCHALSQETDGERVRAAARLFVERERTWANSVGRYDAVYSRVTARQQTGSDVAQQRHAQTSCK